MIRVLVFSAALAALAACSNGEPLAACKGPVFQLNAGYWQPAAAELSNPGAASSR